MSAASAEKEDPFKHFLLAEYNNIAQAHFQTITTLTQFFNYYLLIMAAPATLLTLIPALVSNSTSNVLIFGTAANLSLMVEGVFAAIAIIGYLVMLYIINLKSDALLYARTVNGIRDYFYHNANLDPTTEGTTRVLPRDSKIPPYNEFNYFGPVILTFAFIDGSYLLAALVIGSSMVFNASPFGIPILVYPIAFGIVHLVSYFAYARFRETGYLVPKPRGKP